MKYLIVADTYEDIEKTTKRLEMTDYLVRLLQQTPKEIIDKVIYLTQGKIYPDFVGIEIGIAEKLAVKAIARASGRKENEVENDFKKSGDLGETAQKLLDNKLQVVLLSKPLTVDAVHQNLDKIARAAGQGSIDQKINLFSGLLANASSREAKYLVRTATGGLRLGIADMTVLDALAIAFGGGKETRPILERAYNISSDLGRVARTVAENGIEALKRFKVSLGKPIRAMLAERLSSPKEILEKLGGRCAAEYKYDGERIQAHKDGERVTLFSRKLENITTQYPDAKNLICDSIRAKTAILEAECVAVNLDTGDLMPFQELMHRRRKHEIDKAIDEYPISLFVFDILYADGRDYTLEPYLVRHKTLGEIIEPNERIRVAQSLITNDPDEIEKFFEVAIADGCEGLVCKSIGDESTYQAGSRGWLWIKYKRDYKSEMTDTVDLSIIGAFHGRGKRAGRYGALLLASYNPKEDIFETVCKCGSGFTDEDLAMIPGILEPHKTSHSSPRIISNLEADLWFDPKIVIEIIGAEITLSPIHTCGMDVIRRGSGLAIRFPRFTGKYRIDKSAEESTTANEIAEMYRNQLKSIQE